jgi:hypothetical protein
MFMTEDQESKWPVWTDARGKRVPYDKIVRKKGARIYRGGTVPTKQLRDEKFPESMDPGERGFGVDEDIFVGAE